MDLPLGAELVRGHGKQPGRCIHYAHREVERDLRDVEVTRRLVMTSAAKQSPLMRAPLGRYVVRRLLYALPTLLGFTLAVFLLVRLIPGDPARLIAGLLASDDEVQRLRVELGLDRPMPEQYARFLASVLAG